MTTIHYTPPPDDAPERVLVWCPDTPGWWIGHSSDFVRRYWGRLCTAWKEQGPLPTPEAEPEPVVADEGEKVDPNEPVPLRVGMKVRLRSGTSKTHTVEAVGPGVAYGPGFRISARNVDRWVTDDGRPVCLPDEPAPAAPPFDLAGWIDEQHSAWALIQPCAFSDYLIEQAMDLDTPAEAYTPEQIERAWPANSMVWHPLARPKDLLDALRDGEGE